MSKIGNSIKCFRQKRGLTQRELAELVGTSFSTLRRWEVYEVPPNVSDITKLAAALHVTEAELLNGPGEMNWELKLIFREEGEVKGGTIDMSGSTITTALTVGDAAISLELGGPIELWEDDAKFEGFIDQLRKRRAAGLKMRKEGW